MKKVVVVLGILLVLFAAIAVAGCTSTDGGNADQQGAAPSGGDSGSSAAPAGDSNSIAGKWLCENSKARDTTQPTEVVLNADGSGTVTYYKQIVNGPTTNTVQWYYDSQIKRYHIDSGTATTYLPTAYYDLGADGKLTGSTAVLTKA